MHGGAQGDALTAMFALLSDYLLSRLQTSLITTINRCQSIENQITVQYIETNEQAIAVPQCCLIIKCC